MPPEYACQNGDGRPYAVFIGRPGDSSVDFLCESCNLAMWMAVLMHMTNDGTLTAGVPPAGQ